MDRDESVMTTACSAPLASTSFVEMCLPVTGRTPENDDDHGEWGSRVLAARFFSAACDSSVGARAATAVTRAGAALVGGFTSSLCFCKRVPAPNAVGHHNTTPNTHQLTRRAEKRTNDGHTSHASLALRVPHLEEAGVNAALDERGVLHRAAQELDVGGQAHNLILLQRTVHEVDGLVA